MLEVQVIGNVGADPDMRYTADGTPVTTFSVAADQGKDKAAVWVRCSAWRGLAEMLNQHLTKGTRVFVRGALRVATWEAKDKTFHAGLEVTVDTFQFLGAKAKSEAAVVEDALPAGYAG